MKSAGVASQRVSQVWHRALRVLYYRFVFGRDTRFALWLGRIVHSWESRQEKGDVPLIADAWEAQYRSNRWKYLSQIDELPRYSLIVGYAAHLKPRGAILDIGCGEGILYERLRPYGYSKYLGLDISESSLVKLIDRQDENTRFIKADAEQYIPDEKYDVIVFNESLYYFHNPLQAVARYSRALKEDGVLLVSTYTASARAVSILQRLKDRYSLLDEGRVTHQSSARSWLCSVLAPHRNGDAPRG